MGPGSNKIDGGQTRDKEFSLFIYTFPHNSTRISLRREGYRPRVERCEEATGNKTVLRVLSQSTPCSSCEAE